MQTGHADTVNVYIKNDQEYQMCAGLSIFKTVDNQQPC